MSTGLTGSGSAWEDHVKINRRKHAENQAMQRFVEGGDFPFDIDDVERLRRIFNYKRLVSLEQWFRSYRDVRVEGGWITVTDSFPVEALREELRANGRPFHEGVRYPPLSWQEYISL